MQIVFIDIVSYSRRNARRQVELIDVFTQLIKDSISATRTHHLQYFDDNDISLPRDIILLPTGDGVAVGFPFADVPNLHLYFSTRLINLIHAKNSKANCSEFREKGWCDCHNAFNVRVGLGEGKLILYRDINDSFNIAGNEINMASRVMDCADSNQILLTQKAYEEYVDVTSGAKAQFKAYHNVEIKHGLSISVYQLIDKRIKGLDTSAIRKVVPKILAEETAGEKEKNEMFVPSRVSGTGAKKIKAKTKKIDASLSLELQNNFVLIPPGEYLMGDGRKDHVEVSISRPFYITKFPVTQSFYNTVMNQNPSGFRGDGLPVENVTWYDATQFCNQLSEICGFEPVYSYDAKTVNIDYSKKGFRLPTEAEWEYACRGNSGENYHDKLHELAWYDKNAGKRTHPVGAKKANCFGLFDMLGNIWEWCNDWYGKLPQDSGLQIDPTGPSGGHERVVRGGSWANPDTNILPFHRHRENPNLKDNHRGFRIVLAVD